MNMADRIQCLRKTKGISQEGLADEIGVSRQAVSKWESEQSAPDLEKIIAMSEYFDVTTDYILKGIEPIANEHEKSLEVSSKILYIASTAFIAVGLLCAFGGWHESQTMDVVQGAMIIQAVGVAGYFIGKILSSTRPPFVVNMLNLSLGLFMPISMLAGFLCRYLSWGKIIAPYPMEFGATAILGVIYLAVFASSFIVLMDKRK